MQQKYAEVRKNLKTGDIVLFSGKSAFSKLIRLGSLSKWSHVGVVMNLPEYDFVTVWESTTSSRVEDVASGELKMGVQLVPLSERVNTYNGDISVRHLKGGELTQSAAKELINLRTKLKGTSKNEESRTTKPHQHPCQ